MIPLISNLQSRENKKSYQCRRFFSARRSLPGQRPQTTPPTLPRGGRRRRGIRDSKLRGHQQGHQLIHSRARTLKIWFIWKCYMNYKAVFWGKIFASFLVTSLWLFYLSRNLECTKLTKGYDNLSRNPMLFWSKTFSTFTQVANQFKLLKYITYFQFLLINSAFPLPQTTLPFATGGSMRPKRK